MNMKEFLLKEINIKEMEDGEYIVTPTQIYTVEEYINIIKENKVSLDDVIAIVHVSYALRKSEYHYPILVYSDEILDIALSRKGFYYELLGMYSVFPANPRYLVHVNRRNGDIKIEILDVDIMTRVTNADKIVSETQIEEEDLSIEKYEELRHKFLSQSFAGHYLYEIRELLFKYYDEGDKSLESEVDKIVTEYYKVFKPLKFYI